MAKLSTKLVVDNSEQFYYIQNKQTKATENFIQTGNGFTKEKARLKNLCVICYIVNRNFNVFIVFFLNGGLQAFSSFLRKSFFPHRHKTLHM